MSSRYLKNPLVIALVLIVIAIAGSLYVKRMAPVAQAPGATTTSETSPVAQAPDYSVTSSPAIQWDDELVGQVSKTIYKCADDQYFTARVEVTGTSSALGHAEVFLKDYSKIFLTQTVSGSGVRYANKGGTFVFATKGDGAFIQEGDAFLYRDCVAQ